MPKWLTRSLDVLRRRVPKSKVSTSYLRPSLTVLPTCQMQMAIDGPITPTKGALCLDMMENNSSGRWQFPSHPSLRLND